MAKAIPAREAATSGADGGQDEKTTDESPLENATMFLRLTSKVQPSDTKILHRQQSTNIY